MAERLSVGNRQRERYAREGVDLSLSTLADQVGACAAALRPLHALIQAHVLAAERLALTPPCRSSRKARRRPAESGCMSATIGRLAARILRRRYSTPHAIERGSIPSSTRRTTPEFCKGTRSTATIAGRRHRDGVFVYIQADAAPRPVSYA